MVKFPAKVLQPLKDYLTKREEELKKRKRNLSKEDPFLDTDRLNDNAASDTDAAEGAGHERISALKKEITKNLIRVRKTLTRIKVGKYGICTACKKMIDTDRLAIDPTVELCMRCQRKKSK